jgi:8-oxo-dGTP pyrophosphatase MutT (NUDIX family)
MADRKRKERRRGRTKSASARIETSSGGVVFRRTLGGVRFLLIRDPYANWGLPKGHLEDDETPEQAALREVMEETGLERLAIVDRLPTIDWYFRERGRLIHKFCHFYLVESAEGEPIPQTDEGISACLWCDFPGALDTVTYSNAREVLRAAGDRLNGVITALPTDA